MRNHGVTLIALALASTVFMACSLTNEVTREVRRPLTLSDFRSVDNYVIDSVLHYKIDVRGDTLVCVQRTRAAPAADGTRVPLIFDDVVRAGVDIRDVIMLEYLPEAARIQSGDTLYIPRLALDTARVHVLNPDYVTEMAQQTVLITVYVAAVIGLIIVVAAIVGFFNMDLGGPWGH